MKLFCRPLQRCRKALSHMQLHKIVSVYYSHHAAEGEILALSCRSSLPHPFSFNATIFSSNTEYVLWHENSKMASQINSTPLATAKAFLACIKSRSKDTLTSIVHPDATGCLIRDGKPNHLKLSRVFDRILAVDSGIEMDEISHDEIEHVDGDFASCWTPYNFFENGKVSDSLENYNGRVCILLISISGVPYLVQLASTSLRAGLGASPPLPLSDWQCENAANICCSSTTQAQTHSHSGRIRSEDGSSPPWPTLPEPRRELLRCTSLAEAIESLCLDWILFDPGVCALIDVVQISLCERCKV